MNTFSTIVILSAEVFGAKDNASRTDAMERLFKERGLRYQPIIGVYKDNQEQSFLVELDSPKQVEGMHRIGNMFSQECILVADANRRAYLINADGTETQLGKLQEVSEDKAKTLGAYSIVNGKYYVAI